MSDKSHILIASFLRIAKEDLEGARLLATRDNRNSIYLCEQAAEKIIRAILTSEGVHGGIGHGLRQMIDRGVPDGHPLKQALVDVAILEEYATAYRYPTPAGRVPAPALGGKFAALSQQVETLLQEAAARFGVDLAVKDQPARTPHPIR